MAMTDEEMANARSLLEPTGGPPFTAMLKLRGALSDALDLIADLELKVDCCADACVPAFGEIAKLCGCPEWEYPGQVIRDVQGVVAERDAYRSMLFTLLSFSKPDDQPVHQWDRARELLKTPHRGRGLR